MFSASEAIPEFLPTDPAAPEPVSLVDIALAVKHHLANIGKIGDLAPHLETLTLDDDVRAAVAGVCALGVSSDQAWLLFAHWMNCRTKGLCDAQLAALIVPSLDEVESTILAQALATFEGLLGNRSDRPESIPRPTRRAKRLRAAMRRSGT